MVPFKRAVAFFLLIGIAFSSFNQWLILSSYTLNKNYISTALCSNKDKPYLHCKGKCFLDIKLKQLEQKHKQFQEHLKRIVESIAPSGEVNNAVLFEVNLKKGISLYLIKTPIGKASTIFQPPKGG